MIFEKILIVFLIDLSILMLVFSECQFLLGNNLEKNKLLCLNVVSFHFSSHIIPIYIIIKIDKN